jgi:hypothetical protein
VFGAGTRTDREVSGIFANNPATNTCTTKPLLPTLHDELQHPCGGTGLSQRSALGRCRWRGCSRQQPAVHPVAGGRRFESDGMYRSSLPGSRPPASSILVSPLRKTLPVWSDRAAGGKDNRIDGALGRRPPRAGPRECVALSGSEPGKGSCPRSPDHLGGPAKPRGFDSLGVNLCMGTTWDACTAPLGVGKTPLVLQTINEM